MTETKSRVATVTGEKRAWWGGNDRKVSRLWPEGKSRRTDGHAMSQTLGGKEGNEDG